MTCLYYSLFTLQVVSIYFSFFIFNLFYKLGPHSVHINKIKCVSKMKYKAIRTRIFNTVLKKCLGPSILSLKGQSMLPCPVYIIKWHNLEHGTSANSADFTSFNMWPKQPMVTACFFSWRTSAIHKTVMSLCWAYVFWRHFCKQIIICFYESGLLIFWTHFCVSIN